jgi:transcriptional regulator with XRE-family HTH domain
MILGKIDDLIIDIGSMLKRERLYQNLSQKTVSERSGISESALKNLEAGRGASLSTFIQVCRTLGKDEWIMRLGPTDAVSVEDYAKRGGRPRVRAASSRKVVR